MNARSFRHRLSQRLSGLWTKSRRVSSRLVATLASALDRLVATSIWLWRKFPVYARLLWKVICDASAMIRKRLGKLWRDLVPRWEGLKPGFRRRFLVSLGIALLIEGFLHASHHKPTLQYLEDKAMDWVMGLYRGTTPRRSEPISFTLVDIDESTHLEWQEPLFIPRDKLKILIERILESKPRLLIVDVQVASPGNPTEDELLKGFLEAYGNEASAGAPPVLLATAFRRRSSVSGDEADVLPLTEWQRRDSFLDTAISHSGSIFWAAPLFEQGPDSFIRRWRLWQTACFETGNGPGYLEVVPSMQLLAALVLLENNESLSEGVGRLSKAVLATQARLSCGAPHASPASQSRPHRQASVFKVGEIAISLESSELNRRIVFRYPQPNALRRRGHRQETYPRNPATGDPMLTVVSAAPLARANQHVDNSVFEDRIVVIGGSFRDSRDIYPTPFGPMSGGMILINAIDSLLEYHEMKLLPWPLRYGITAVLVLAISLIFTIFHTIKGALLASLVLLFALLPASVFIFHAGYWLDFAIPFCAVFLHNLAGEFEAAFAS